MPEPSNSYSPPMPEPRNSYSPPMPEPRSSYSPPEPESEPEPDIETQIQTLHETLTHEPLDTIEDSLTAVGIRPSHDIIYSVLLLSYATPDAAVKFFRWAGRTIKPLQEAWNLIVDILGKSEMFEEMWEAVRAMKREGVVGLSTFGVIFECYCRVNRFDEAVMSFEVMGKYGLDECVEGVNLLLGWMCGESGGVEKADDFYDRVKSIVLPDGDTFRVLLEGCEREGNAERAMSMFGEMVVRVGWSKENVAAYDAFLGTLVGTRRADEAIEFLEVIRKHECLPSSKFFVFAVENLVREDDAKNCIVLWDTMVEGGMVPNLVMYNEMIGLLCRNGDDENAIRLLDQMVFHGAFPDTFTYNVIFECLLKKNKAYDVEKFFYEMVKNECPPSNSNCSSAIAMLFEGDDPDAAVEIWDYLVENNVRPLDECGNALLIGLCKLGRFVDLSRFANDMLDMEINIYESTMSTLKNDFLTYGRGEDFESLSRRWEDS